MAAAERSWNIASELARSEDPDNRWIKWQPILAHQYGRALALNGRNSEAVPVFSQSIASWDARAKASPTAHAREAVQSLQAANARFPPTRDVWPNWAFCRKKFF